MKNFLYLFLCLSINCGFYSYLFSQETITYDKLLEEMVNFDRLSSEPDNSYKSIQFSSYDRRSISPNKEGWFANSDGFGREPIPGFEQILKEPDENGIGEYLICDVKKPGAILRLWSARINGKVRVYLDNMESPFYEGSAEDFFWRTPEVLVGEQVPENLFRQFDALYFPVPFSKRLRIEWIGNLNELHFYHVGLRVYDSNINIETFSKQNFSKHAEKFEHVIERLKNYQKGNEQNIQFENEIIPATQKNVIWESECMGAIESLFIRTEAPDIENALRKCILNIYFDGSPTPQVQAPLGDFFGAAPGINPFNSMAFSVYKDGTMISRFLMPYKQNAKIEIENNSQMEINLSFNIQTKKYLWQDGTSMHFRARWRMKHEVSASNRTIIDYPYLMAIGKGRLVGAATYVYNPSNVPTSNGNWWGEGDEKIFVDGESFPPFFGTGSEDYYNYSWSSARIFSFPYCGQPRNDGPGNRGYAANFRWHILDDIPFNQSIAFYMELYHHGVVPKFSYGSIIYYYAIPGTIDDYQQISMTDIRDLTYHSWSPEPYRGSAGYQFLNAEDIVERIPSAHVKEGKKWAGGKILMWQPEKTGERLKLTFSNDINADENRIGLTMAKMPEGGLISIFVNGKKVKLGGQDIVSLYEENQTVLDNYFTDPLHLKAGKNEIVIENRENESGKKVGVDFLWIRE
jgi:hypothetical protein